MLKALFSKTLILAFLFSLFFFSSTKVFAASRQDMIDDLAQLLDDAWYESEELRMRTPEEFKAIAERNLLIFDQAKALGNLELIGLKDKSFWNNFLVDDKKINGTNLFCSTMVNSRKWDAFRRSKLTYINWATFFAIFQVEKSLSLGREDYENFFVDGLVNAHEGKELRDFLAQGLGYCHYDFDSRNDESSSYVSQKQVDELVINLMIYQGYHGGGNFSAVNGDSLNQTVFQRWWGYYSGLDDWTRRANAMYGAITTFARKYSDYSFLLDNILDHAQARQCQVNSISGTINVHNQNTFDAVKSHPYFSVNFSSNFQNQEVISQFYPQEELVFNQPFNYTIYYDSRYQLSDPHLSLADSNRPRRYSAYHAWSCFPINETGDQHKTIDLLCGGKPKVFGSIYVVNRNHHIYPFDTFWFSFKKKDGTGSFQTEDLHFPSDADTVDISSYEIELDPTAYDLYIEWRENFNVYYLKIEDSQIDLSSLQDVRHDIVFTFPTSRNPSISSVTSTSQSFFGDDPFESYIHFSLDGNNFYLTDTRQTSVCIKELNRCYSQPSIADLTNDHIDLVLDQISLFDYIVTNRLNDLTFTVARRDQLSP